MAVSLLGPDHVREYVQAVFGADRVPDALPSLVFARTEGNPLFMVEVVRYLRQREYSSRVPALTRDVPDSLRGLIDKMLDGLEPESEVARMQGAATFELRAALGLAQLEPQAGRKAVRSALDRIREPEAWPEVTAAHGCLRQARTDKGLPPN